jgi:hypothetical protein
MNATRKWCGRLYVNETAPARAQQLDLLTFFDDNEQSAHCFVVTKPGDVILVTGEPVNRLKARRAVKVVSVILSNGRIGFIYKDVFTQSWKLPTFNEVSDARKRQNY